MVFRTYSEVSQFHTLEERFAYLALNGSVGEETFGHHRDLNQRFYTSTAWRRIRQHVIARDEGCDLGIPGFEIYSNIYIHHMNPLRVKDLVDGDPAILDPEFLISTTHRTHNAIHYGDEKLLPRPFIERSPRDHVAW
jgi:hypothetical protein